MEVKTPRSDTESKITFNKINKYTHKLDNFQWFDVHILMPTVSMHDNANPCENKMTADNQKPDVFKFLKIE